MKREDLVKMTWCYENDKIIGKYGKDENENDVYIYSSSFVAVDAKNPKSVVRCNLEEEWCEEQIQLEEGRFAIGGKTEIIRYPYKGRIQIKEFRHSLFDSPCIYEVKK